jgi:hypothetical protein
MTVFFTHIDDISLRILCYTPLGIPKHEIILSTTHSLSCYS